jgi:hypothetical protein
MESSSPVRCKSESLKEPERLPPPLKTFEPGIDCSGFLPPVGLCANEVKEKIQLRIIT